MTTKAKAAKGTLVKIGDGEAVEAFTTIGEVTSFNGPNGTLTTVDATSFDSVAEEFIAGLPSSGEVSIDYLFVGSNTAQAQLEEDRAAGNLRNFEITLADHATTPTKYSFAALVTAVSITGGGPNAAYTGSATLKISGAVTKSGTGAA